MGTAGHGFPSSHVRLHVGVRWELHLATSHGDSRPHRRRATDNDIGARLLECVRALLCKAEQARIRAERGCAAGGTYVTGDLAGDASPAQIYAALCG
jgi:hypothetical protein